MRFLTAAAIGLSVTLMLFLLMHFLVSGQQEFDATRLGGSLLEFIRVDEEEVTQLKEREPPEEPTPPEPIVEPVG